MTSRSGSGVIVAIIIIALLVGGGAFWYISKGNSEEDLLPGEKSFLVEVESAEELMSSAGNSPTPENCSALRTHFANGVTAFEKMTPHLEGFALRKRDDRLGKIREYTEAECR